ncbi:MAG TPA: peptidase M23 [Bacteroidia bacterium]|nr:peptidase M23 [Bacteroidia bacterium]
MKKIVLKIVSVIFVSAMLLTGCSTPAEKVEKAQEDVNEANKKLDRAQEEYVTDIDNYRKIEDEKIDANNQNIADFKARIEHDKKEAKAEYERKIAELEQKNSDMKKKMDDYKADGKENWELFKADFNKGMDEIEQSLKDLTAKHPAKDKRD